MKTNCFPNLHIAFLLVFPVSLIYCITYYSKCNGTVQYATFEFYAGTCILHRYLPSCLYMRNDYITIGRKTIW